MKESTELRTNGVVRNNSPVSTWKTSELPRDRLRLQDSKSSILSVQLLKENTGGLLKKVELWKKNVSTFSANTTSIKMIDMMTNIMMNVDTMIITISNNDMMTIITINMREFLEKLHTSPRQSKLHNAHRNLLSKVKSKKVRIVLLKETRRAQNLRNKSTQRTDRSQKLYPLQKNPQKPEKLQRYPLSRNPRTPERS